MKQTTPVSPSGSAAHGRSARAILDDFRFPGNGKHERHLKNLYVYFWRWGTWKVWESTAADPDGDTGVVCFISTSGYLRGPGFKGMRKYLRTHASEGWVIDLTPEGQRPDVPTRIFPGVQQPLAIGLFVRRPDTDPDLPAVILDRRWRAVVAESDREVKRKFFRETPGVTLDRAAEDLPGTSTQTSSTPFYKETGPPPAFVAVGYRSLDRQLVIPDARLMQRPGPLWEARVSGQVFTVEQHSKPISDGPGLVFSALIPELDHFKGSEGGRALPLLHPDGTPNLAPGLVRTLSATLGHDVTATHVLAYLAGAVAHPGFTRTFADELTTPGIRVPLTTDPALWAEAIALGEQVVWLHTYGGTFTDPTRPAANVRYPTGDARQPLSLTPITAMPGVMTYDPARAVVALGDGEFGPVTPQVWAYAVGGKHVLKSWFNYGKKVPGGKKTSPLDYIHVEVLDPEWTTEFIDLLTVLTRLVELEPAQADLLERILAGSLLTMDDLRVAGVRWPTKPADRRPHRGGRRAW